MERFEKFKLEDPILNLNGGDYKTLIVTDCDVTGVDIYQESTGKVFSVLGLEI